MKDRRRREEQEQKQGMSSSVLSMLWVARARHALDLRRLFLFAFWSPHGLRRRLWALSRMERPDRYHYRGRGRGRRCVV